MIAASFWAVLFIVIAVAAGLGTILTTGKNLLDNGEPAYWVPFVIGLVIVVAFSAGAAAAFIRLAGWS
jgi:hypothetical protein